ncbi:oligosaccharide biosynthesis protein Alg14 [Mucilaginibacter conchicola]|uniref:Oligosaccharide biosynthesis protein Alg14 n=2 Tax=Mucilaginibacter conchicola TaxID=2303333 RepID=A0A372P0D7_9SPHI|nr:oligosaccharide biosynthesis protein Alg14 [Mucilaginibacter conchicola]
MQIDPAERSATVLAIASIGGHWVELQRLSPLFKEHDVTYISNTRNMDTKVKGSKHYYVPDANKDRKLDLIKCFFAVLRRVILLKPRVVITTGAAPGLMGIVVGKILGAKTIWIDSIANVEKLSLSGRIALKVADRVYTQWEHLSNDKIVYSGNLL